MSRIDRLIPVTRWIAAIVFFVSVSLGTSIGLLCQRDVSVEREPTDGRGTDAKRLNPSPPDSSPSLVPMPRLAPSARASKASEAGGTVSGVPARGSALDIDAALSMFSEEEWSRFSRMYAMPGGSELVARRYGDVLVDPMGFQHFAENVDGEKSIPIAWESQVSVLRRAASTNRVFPMPKEISRFRFIAVMDQGRWILVPGGWTGRVDVPDDIAISRAASQIGKASRDLSKEQIDAARAVLRARRLKEQDLTRALWLAAAGSLRRGSGAEISSGEVAAVAALGNGYLFVIRVGENAALDEARRQMADASRESYSAALPRFHR